MAAVYDAMNILILTSKDHIYANVILRSLYTSGMLAGETVEVWEQDAIVPGKSRVQGLKRYIQRSGLRYVLLQVIKQLLFLFLRAIGRIQQHEFTTKTVNGVKSDRVFAMVNAFRPSLILSIYSKEIIPDRILSIPKFGAVNLHPALLPSFRGVSPVFWAMAQGVRNVGITLHYLDTGIDTGALIRQQTMRITSHESEHAAYMRLTHLGMDMLLPYLRRVLVGKKPRGKPMKKAAGSYYSLPTKEAVRALYHNGYAIVRLNELLCMT